MYEQFKAQLWKSRNKRLSGQGLYYRYMETQTGGRADQQNIKKPKQTFQVIPI